ncbi:MAG: energy transducer TonB, partial [Paracoccus sp. (in: a-proteobacteria)]|nr:energy transducer TonB [Paracoccus sp. (in: a-proteobacteria)]
PRGLRRGGQVTLALIVSRAGTIQQVSIAASSGQSAIDQAVLRAARGVGRCPAAPAGLNDAAYSFQLPITIQLR